MIRIGYAAINTELAKESITVNRTARLATVERIGIEPIREMINQNLDDMFKILQWNEKHGIRFYRMSSDMFPHFSSDKLSKEIIEDYTLAFVKEKLALIGKFARDNGHRLTFHPAQFVNLGSDRPEVIKSSIRELAIHADIFLALGMKPEHGSVMVFHGGGTYGDKPATVARFRETLSKIPPNVRDYLSLENDERQYSPDDLLPICEDFGIPFTFDVFHYKCMFGEPAYTKMLADDAFWERIRRTWTARGSRQKIHISTQRPDSRMGAHSDIIDPAEIKLRTLLQICRDRSIDIMVEAKFKEEAVLRIYNEFFNQINNNGRIEWYLR